MLKLILSIFGKKMSTLGKFQFFLADVFFYAAKYLANIFYLGSKSALFIQILNRSMIENKNGKRQISEQINFVRIRQRKI